MTLQHNSSRRATNHRWAVWLVLIVLNTAAAVVSQLLWLFPSSEPYSFGNYAAFGLSLSHSATAACWLVLCCEPFLPRLIKSLSIVFASWTTFACCLFIGLKEGRARPVVAFGGCFAVIFGAFILSQAALWFARLAFGWRMVGRGETSPDTPGKQFGIAGLFIATAAVALLMLIIKTTIQLTATELRGRLLIVFAIAIGCCIFGLLPAIVRLVLAPTWSGSGLALVVVLLVLPLAIGDPRALRIFFCEFAFCISLAINLAALRYCGYRLNP